MSIGLALSPRRRLAAGGVVVAVLAVLAIGSFLFLGGGDGDNDNATTRADAPAAAPVTSPGIAPPELRTTGDDWDQIVRSIVAYEDWLYAHNPDPELLTKTEVPSYQFFDDRQLGLRNLATKGWRYDPPYKPLPVELVRFQGRTAENVVTIFVRFGPTPGQRVVDSAGTVIQETPESPPNAVIWTLVREPASDPHWRLFKVTPLTDEPGPAPA